MRAFSILAASIVAICLILGMNLSTMTALSSPMEAIVNIDPNTLNLKSRGELITVYIELPEPFNVSDIDISTILLDGVVPSVSDPKYGYVKNLQVGDADENGVPELMIKFDRQAMIDYVLTYKLYHMGIVPPLPKKGVEIDLELTFALIDGTMFEGIDEIRVILQEPSSS